MLWLRSSLLPSQQTTAHPIFFSEVLHIFLWTHPIHPLPCHLPSDNSLPVPVHHVFVVSLHILSSNKVHWISRCYQYASIDTSRRISSWEHCLTHFEVSELTHQSKSEAWLISWLSFHWRWTIAGLSNRILYPIFFRKKSKIYLHHNHYHFQIISLKWSYFVEKDLVHTGVHISFHYDLHLRFVFHSN